MTATFLRLRKNGRNMAMCRFDYHSFLKKFVNFVINDCPFWWGEFSLSKDTSLLGKSCTKLNFVVFHSIKNKFIRGYSAHTEKNCFKRPATLSFDKCKQVVVLTWTSTQETLFAETTSRFPPSSSADFVCAAVCCVSSLKKASGHHENPESGCGILNQGETCTQIRYWYC